MAQMSPQDRQLLVMKFLEEWSSEELAEHLKLSVETVLVRLHRAKSRLKKLVEQNEQP
jgi:RNA polymerase sigma factor (sigma-70 family)